MIDYTKIRVRHTGQGGSYGEPMIGDDIPWQVREGIAEQIIRDAAYAGVCEAGGQRYVWSQIGAVEAAEIAGRRIGRAMARDVRAEGMPRAWTGLDDQDGDVATAAGIEPGTPEWAAMEAAARAEYERKIG